MSGDFEGTCHLCKSKFNSIKAFRDHVNNHCETSDKINPAHYKSHPSGIECIEITRHMNFNLGNAIKYIWRAGLKDDVIQELEKAKWYIEDEIKKRKGEYNENQRNSN